MNAANGTNSWPMALIPAFVYRSKTMSNCRLAAGLASFIYWAQTSTTAQQIATRQGFAVTSKVPRMKRQFLLQLRDFTCDGVVVSSVAPCIDDAGLLCSDAGQCVSGTCQCDKGREGQYCELITSASSSSDETVAIALGIAIPVGVVVACILLLIIALIVLLIRLRRDKTDDWEIDYDELEVGEQLGAGGHGQVFKAMWKGTEVAVKLMASDKVNKEMEKSFKDEVRYFILWKECPTLTITRNGRLG